MMVGVDHERLRVRLDRVMVFNTVLVILTAKCVNNNNL